MDEKQTRVLLVEDCDADACLVEAMLRASPDLRVLFQRVNSLGGAQALLKSEPVDLLLADLRLPDSDGLQTVTRFLTQFPDIPLMVLSGMEDLETAIRAVREGAQDYLTKGSFDSRFLSRAIRHALERHTLRIELRQALAREQASRENWKSLVSDSQEAMLLFDAGDRVVFCNAATQALYACELGGDCAGVLLSGSVDAGSPAIEVRRPDGTSRTCDVSLSRVSWNGEPAKLIVLRDVTERRLTDARLDRLRQLLALVLDRLKCGFDALAAGQLDARLDESVPDSNADPSLSGLLVSFNKMATRLQSLSRETATVRSMLAHDLRSPVSSILLAIETLKAIPESNVQSRKAIEATIERACKRLLGLLGNLLELLAAEGGSLKLSAFPFSLVEVAGEVVQGLRPQAQQRDLSLQLELELEEAHVVWDELRFVQILGNLIGNALKFAPVGSHVRVRFETPKEGWVRGSVEDAGPGINPHERERIFESYERGEPQTGHVGGMGLGLAVCKLLVESHGGRLWVEGVASGGSRFVFELPVELPRKPHPSSG